MRTSDKGIAFLERHEGVVLRAYRDAAGVWTIGAGLTKASGVVVPRHGMVITRAEATALLQRALPSYEEAVIIEMAQLGRRLQQHELDAGVSFHFNTGAIVRASWVSFWKLGNLAETKRRLLMWVKGGGKVLPGLKRRREEEFELLNRGIYAPAVNAACVPGSIFAPFVVSMTPEEAEGARAAMASLGFSVGTAPGKLLVAGVAEFQRRYDLTVDGKIGRATLSTLQRAIDARRRAVTAGGVSVASASPTVAAPELSHVAGADWPLLSVSALAALALLWLAWTYRDALAARLHTTMPGLAGWLRRI